MPKRSSKKTPDAAPAEPETKKPVPEIIPGPARDASDGKNPAAVALGRRGGLKGGKARAAKLTKEQRSEIAKKAASARWKKKA
jgi:hypothetical protein